MDYNTLIAIIGDLYVQLKLKDKELFEKDQVIEQLKGQILQEKKRGNT
jgi:hypothetical protein